MSDTEIIKEATEAYNQNLNAGCYVGDLLGIINRQEQEKQNLEIELKAMRGAANSYKAEVERLRATLDSFTDIGKLYSEIKAEAYKEFADDIEKAFSKTESQMPNSKVIKQTVQIRRNAIRLALNELTRDNNEL